MEKFYITIHYLWFVHTGTKLVVPYTKNLIECLVHFCFKIWVEKFYITIHYLWFVHTGTKFYFKICDNKFHKRHLIRHYQYIHANIQHINLCVVRFERTYLPSF